MQNRVAITENRSRSGSMRLSPEANGMCLRSSLIFLFLCDVRDFVKLAFFYGVYKGVRCVKKEEINKLIERILPVY